MKVIIAAIVLFGLAAGAHAQLTTNQPARLKIKIIRFEGKTNSGVLSSSICGAPETMMSGNGGEDNETTPGHKSDLKWEFIGRNKDKDVYHFTFIRTTKSDSSDLTITSKDIQFDGKQVIVFEDALHTVVMETPTPEDLKTGGHR